MPPAFPLFFLCFSRSRAAHSRRWTRRWRRGPCFASVVPTGISATSFCAAARDGLRGFLLLSGYRSREYQAEIFANAKPGYVAHPGASEHETGLAMDISAETGNDTHFEDTPHFAWLTENAWRFGLILRYPKGKERFTGVFYEEHHFRFVGREAARKIREGGMSLEEYCAEG